MSSEPNISGSPSTRFRKASILRALSKHQVNVSQACSSCGISRRTYYNYLNTDDAFACKVDEIVEAQIDMVEKALFDNIEAGNERSIIFYLKTKGRNRGYGHTPPISRSEPTTPNPNEGALSDENLSEFLNQIQRRIDANAARRLNNPNASSLPFAPKQ